MSRFKSEAEHFSLKAEDKMTLNFNVQAGENSFFMISATHSRQ